MLSLCLNLICLIFNPFAAEHLEMNCTLSSCSQRICVRMVRLYDMLARIVTHA